MAKFISKLYGSLEVGRVDVLFGTYSKASFMMFCALLEEDVPTALLLCGCGCIFYRGDCATLLRLFDYCVFCCLAPLVFQKDFVC